MEIQEIKDLEIDRATPWHEVRDQRILVSLSRKGVDARHHPHCVQCLRMIRVGQRMITVLRCRASATNEEIHFHEECFKHPIHMNGAPRINGKEAQMRL